MPPARLTATGTLATTFSVGRELSDTQALGPKLPALLEDDFTLMMPLVRWLNGALGLKPAKER